ncbi:hypothetical protein DRO42_02340 [Candidatus Bathyarchaeota archaeon]|nr:MAG: hypothetical protein DRO42_02340 [Candidatus Bathyarchaeota archaeon]
MMQVRSDLLEAFWVEWFGPEPRELGDPVRWIAPNPADLLELAPESQGPVFMSVNYYEAPNTVSSIDKLFFDFDHEDLNLAWEDARVFAHRLRTYYGIEPLLCFSGRKGYHLYAFLERPIGRDLSPDHLKAIYDRLQRMLIGRGEYPTLDRAVLGDVKRLARVPYTRHEKSGELCVPVDMERRPVLLLPGFKQAYREHGVPYSLTVQAARQITEEILDKSTKRRRMPSQRRRLEGMRPCIAAAINSSHMDHKMRVAVAAELHADGWSEPRIIDAFRGQGDFNPKVTAYQVRSVIRGGIKPFRCSTIQGLGGCLGDSCSIYRWRKRKGGEKNW